MNELSNIVIIFNKTQEKLTWFFKLTYLPKIIAMPYSPNSKHLFVLSLKIIHR